MNRRMYMKMVLWIQGSKIQSEPECRQVEIINSVSNGPISFFVVLQYTVFHIVQEIDYETYTPHRK